MYALICSLTLVLLYLLFIFISAQQSKNLENLPMKKAAMQRQNQRQAIMPLYMG